MRRRAFLAALLAAPFAHAQEARYPRVVRGRRLVFCEVKMRRSSGFGDPLEAIDGEKRRRVTRAAESFLARNPGLAGLDVSLEAVAVRGRRIVRVSM